MGERKYLEFISTKKWKKNVIEKLNYAEDSIYDERERLLVRNTINFIKKLEDNYLEIILRKLGYSDGHQIKSKQLFLLTYFSSGELYSEYVCVFERDEICKRLLHMNEGGIESIISSKDSCTERMNMLNEIKKKDHDSFSLNDDFITIISVIDDNEIYDVLYNPTVHQLDLIRKIIF